MKYLYVFLLSLCLTFVNLLYIKNFQLENYRIKNYLKNILKLNYCFGNKNNLKYTKRAKRTIFLCFFCNYLLFLFIFIFFDKLSILLLLTFFVFLLSPFYVCLAFLFSFPIENFIKCQYIKKAKKKLEKMKCKKIAITGSYGKTSTKDILYQILKTEFDVCKTAKSFNTPMGVCKTILEELKETDDFFIVEMGARHSGDIDFLSKFVKVDFGIITPIGNCHLQTFGTIEKIEDTKYELCENTRGVIVFNGRSKSTKKLYRRYPYKKFLVCEKDSFAFATKVETSVLGSNFILVVDGKEVDCQTNLLGEANVDNIVVASAMAYVLGVSLFGIKKAIKNLRPSPHRLELIRGRVNIIDDSYNSNFAGFEEALKVLSTFSGRKIVVSPGIVETGDKQREENYQIGKKIASVADFFVIMNETNSKNLLKGALDGGLKREKIFFAKSRKEQKQALKELVLNGDNILFENDFPDNIR